MFLLDFRSIIDSNGLLGFKTYINLILCEIIEGRNHNTVQDLVLERLIAYYSTYRNAGDIDFRSGEIFDEVKKLSAKERVTLAKHFKALLDCESLCQSELDWNSYIKNAIVRDE